MRRELSPGNLALGPVSVHVCGLDPECSSLGRVWRVHVYFPWRDDRIMNVGVALTPSARFVAGRSRLFGWAATTTSPRLR